MNIEKFKETEDLPVFLKVEDIAKIFDVSENTARRECKYGSLSDISEKMGRRYFVSREALMKKFNVS